MHLDTDVIVVVIISNISAESPLLAKHGQLQHNNTRALPTCGVTTAVAKSTKKKPRGCEHEYIAETKIALTTRA
jgi:hypothetical protein